MKKVTIFTLQLYGGGIEKYSISLANMLSKDYKVELVSVYKYDKPTFEIYKKVKLLFLTNDYKDKNSLKKLIKNYRFLKALIEIKRRLALACKSNYNISRYIKHISSDYVITTTMSLNKKISRKLKNKKIIKIATEHNFPGDEDYLARIVSSIRGYDYLILGTRELVDLYKNKITPTRCLHIPNCIDDIPTEKSKLNVKNLISVGRFSPEKGFLDLIDVFSIVNKIDPDINLFLLGDGYYKDEILNKIKEKQLEEKIIMPGFIIGNEQKKYYLNSSLYIMTSFTECFGIVLIEAMSYGVPCIAFDSASGPRELLANKVGILIKDRDKEEMAKQIVYFLHNKEVLKKLASRIDVEKYSLSFVYKEWQNILK